MVEKSTRRFSKTVATVNLALAWSAIFYSIYQGQATAIAVGAFGLIGTIYGAYVGVGHLDYRVAADAQKEVEGEVG